jgi:hypothetical protein
MLPLNVVIYALLVVLFLTMLICSPNIFDTAYFIGLFIFLVKHKIF